MEIEEKIRKQKRLHRVIFRKYKIKSSDWTDLGLALLASSVVGSWLDLFFGNDLVIAVVVSLVTVAVKRMWNNDTEGKIHPYAPTKEFMGLYCVGDIKEQKELDELKNNKGLIIKTNERDYIVHQIEAAIRDNCAKSGIDKAKRGLCLVGKSGSGKSTLLSIVRLELENKKWLVRDFSNGYVGGGIDVRTDTFVNEKVDVAVFDQFERLFQEDEKSREKVFEQIRLLAEDDVLVLFSIREEALLSFLKLVDLSHVECAGKHYPWCNSRIHNCEKALYVKDTMSRPNIGNIIIVGGDRTKSEEALIQRKCQKVFSDDENWEEIYKKVKNHPLIEQQILLNMRQNRDIPLAAKETFAGGDFAEVMKWYYDVQLCSTGDYFNASRIMYLMSMMRQKNEAFTTSMIMDALCVPQGHGEKHDEEKDDFKSAEERLKNCLDALAERSLLKVKNNGTHHYYEVSHDYIAESFETYANTELPSNVKTALDDYRSGHERRRKMDNLSYKRNLGRHQKERQADGWVLAVWVIAFLCVCVYYGMGMAAAVYPGIPVPFGTTPLPLPVLIVVVFSLFYIFCIYRNVTYYYGIAFPEERNVSDSLRKIVVRLLYLFTMIAGTCAVLAGEHWLVFLGIGNILNAFAWIFVAKDGRMSSFGRKHYRQYGLREFSLGLLLILLSKFLMLATFRTIRFGVIEIGEIGTVMQLIAMAALLAYGYLTHINREFFYANLEPLFNM